MRRFAPILVALVVAGCGAPDPATSLLKPGQVVVVATNDAFLSKKDGPSTGISLGATVRVGVDPGHFDLTQELIDAKREHNLVTLDVDVSRGPLRFEAGEPGSGYRQIEVVVETGELIGQAGITYRKNLRPLP